MLIRMQSLSVKFWTAMFYVFHAFCLNALVVHGISENEVVGTGPIPNPGAVNKPCKISYITNQNNASVVKNCTCEEAAEDSHVNDISRLSNPNGGANSLNSPSSPWVEGTGNVPNGTLCMISVSDLDKGRNIVAGICYNGKCDNKTTRTVRVPIPTLEADPYAYHCKGPMVAINSKLNVSANCTATCYNLTTNTWVNARLGDGRLCALVLNKNKDGEYIKRTGVCNKGSCVPADLKPLSPPDDCPAKYVKRSGISLAQNCTATCKTTGTKKRLPRGTRCLLNYHRRVSVPGVENLIADGICKHGICIVIPPAVPTLMVHVPEEKCDHLLASVNYTKKVASMCNAKCPGRAPEYQPLRNGTACALKQSWGWHKEVTEVGECQAGNCVKEDHKIFPPPHHQKSNSTQCRTDNYVEVKPGQITVVKSCQVECSYSVFERRSYGVDCLLEYSETKQGGKIYTIGTCMGGFCTLGLKPRNITTTD
uniref:Basic tail secreted protein n=1 Tax=Rhipicephalus appendiculatus TaxID=34631 RepID=A0A131YQH0_RHIAP